MLNTIETIQELPIAAWTGRMVFDRARRGLEDAVFLEIQNAPPGFEEFVGREVRLAWDDNPETRAFVRALSVNMRFGPEAERGRRIGRIHPVRLNGLDWVGPLESLAAAYLDDDTHVMLTGPVEPSCGALLIRRTPVLIRGRSRCLVKFEARSEANRHPVRHFNRLSRQFDGPLDLAHAEVSLEGIESCLANEQGWYVYGQRAEDRSFRVEAMEPRRCLRLEPDRVILGLREGRQYVWQENWADTPQRKGTAHSVLIDPHAEDEQEALAQWREGDEAMVLHLFGGMGGKTKSGAMLPEIVPGHFGYGSAVVKRDPLSGDLYFEIVHRQMLAHNQRGIISGPHLWASSMGDVQRGWFNTRPISEIIVKFPPATRRFDGQVSALDAFMQELDELAARYRTGDGDGSTSLDASITCVRDANRALIAALGRTHREIERSARMAALLAEHPFDEQLLELRRLRALTEALEEMSPRSRKRRRAAATRKLQGLRKSGGPMGDMLHSVKTWRGMLPRRTHDELASIFLNHGAKLWFIRTNQIGAHSPNTWPVAPSPPLRQKPRKPVKVL